MAANRQGRTAINAVFPDIHIEWRFHKDCRCLGWGEFSLNVADIAHTMRNHRLPIEIVRTADLDAATPEALAFLLAMAAKREGVRVACESEPFLRGSGTLPKVICLASSSRDLSSAARN
jgi:hypothetical protein